MRPDGCKNGNSSENAKRVAALWAIALLWCAFSGFAIYVWALQADSIAGSAIAGFFLLIGLVVLSRAVRKTLALTGRAPKSDPLRPATPRVASVNPVVSMRDQRSGHRKLPLAGVAALVLGAMALAWLFEGDRLLDRLTAWEKRTALPAKSSHEVEEARPARPAQRSNEAHVEVQPEASDFQSLPDKEIIVRIRRGFKAMMAGRHEEALRLYGEALSMAESAYGASSLLAAVVSYQISEVHQQQKNYVEQERALRRALAILEQYSIAELRRSPELGNDGIDVAQVAADLGYIYWEWRRYAEAYSWYERAHQAGRDSAASEWVRNRRLAVSSAGLMASACMLGKWDVADQAMAELKERMERVDDRLRSWLDYWVRTGEPRLAARKC